MKYTDHSAVAQAIKRLEEIREIEQELNDGTVSLNKSTAPSFAAIKFNPNAKHKTWSNQEEKLQATIGRLDAVVLNSIRHALQEYKKDLCTYLHDAGVDIRDLAKELGL